MPDNCPVCASLLEKTESRGDKTFYSCPRCGQFVLTGSIIGTLPSILGGKNERIATLSHAIRKMQGEGGEPFLNTDLVERIMKIKLPNPSQQANNFILWLGENLSGPGEIIWVEPAKHQSIMGAQSPDGFALVLKHLFKKELVTGNVSETMGYPGRAHVTLSMEGWDYFDELKRGAKDSRKACEWKSNMGPVMAIQNGPTRFIATPTGQASRRPGQASPEPAAPYICGRLWARPAYNSRSFFRPRLALSAPGCWPPQREPSRIIPLSYSCSPGTGSFPRSWSGCGHDGSAGPGGPRSTARCQTLVAIERSPGW